ncbi:hypothetical protein BDM02DRAFT_3114536 [Thelephora ganbajun]|uniref:Uncharacterized protein n=1 Tax=Thelephora ganbajun TaxID=370292 RepID=A0ACB6ZH68_THEGA|nr:hypothetical protein BDM02DRAFT_3114536 [Thelephora ganbajun]
MDHQLSVALRVNLTTLLLLLACPMVVHAVKMDECGARLKEAQAVAWNATHSSVPPPLQITYEQCLVECGGGLGDISWSAFSQSVITWFIPWVALSFQIPFSAENPLDDILAFFLTVGSPALAAYSLQITQLNARWLTQAFSDIDYHNSAAIPTVVSALQHVPIRLSSDPTLLPSLIVLPQNGAYWRILLKSARKIRRWSISLVVNFAWVIVTAVVTIADTFYRPIPGEIGYGTVTSLAYLLPLMIGWLHVGSEPEPNHLKDSLEEASSVARVATNSGDEPVLAESPTGQRRRAIEFVKRLDVDLARRDELRTNPIFNSSRVFVWSQIAEVIYTLARNAAAKGERRLPAHGSATMDGQEEKVAIEARNWTAYEVIYYCGGEDTAFERFFRAPRPILPSLPGTSNSHGIAAGLLPFFVNYTGIQEPSLWATGVWKRVALATGLALGLQWGITGAGILIYYKMHPVGLGCRATSLLIYGILGTVSFFLLLVSSVLAHLSRPRSGSRYRYSRVRSFQETGAILSRWLGKALGMISGLGILVISLIQPLGIFSNCWCSTMTFDRPEQFVAFMTGNFASEWGVFKVWVGGLAMALATATLFGFSMYLGTPPGR